MNTGYKLPDFPGIHSVFITGTFAPGVNLKAMPTFYLYSRWLNGFSFCNGFKISPWEQSETCIDIFFSRALRCFRILTESFVLLCFVFGSRFLTRCTTESYSLLNKYCVVSNVECSYPACVKIKSSFS